MRKFIALVFLSSSALAASPPDVSSLLTTVLIAAPNAPPSVGYFSMINMQISYSWKAPTRHKDGTLITAPLSYVIYRGTAGKMKMTSLQTAKTTLTWAEPLPVGSIQCFGLVVIENGVQSDLGPLACVVPKAPTGFKMT
jgi:hypothetical protein